MRSRFSTFGWPVLSAPLLAAVLLFSPGCRSGARSDKGPIRLHLTILHVNDTHGHLYPHDFNREFNVGGAARMATRIEQVRRERPGRTLLLHAGDIFSRGGPLTVYTAGGADMQIMQIMGFDAMVPGNGEFYTGVENLKEKAAQVDFPVLMANVHEGTGGGSLFPPFAVKTIDGLKIGILGLGFFKDTHPATWGLTQRSPEAAALEHLPELREKVDLVIALTHLGIELDLRLAARVPGIDVIVGGHSHEYLTQPRELTGPDGNRVLYVQAGIFGTHMGRLDLYLEKSGGAWQIRTFQGKLLPITADIPEDPQVAQLLAELSRPLQEVLCYSHVTMENPPQGCSPMGEFLVQAIHRHLPAQAAVLFRPAVQSGIMPGPVSMADVCRIHSWRSRVLRLSLTGRQLERALAEQEVFAAGLRFQRSGDRIQAVTVSGEAIDFQQTYHIVADEAWLMNLDSLQHIPFQETGERVDTILAKHLKEVRVLRK